MQHIITLLVALLGSGLISTVLTLIANQWRHDRHLDHMGVWRNEDDQLHDLERRAGVKTPDHANQPRNIALAVSARTQINAAVAKRLIPSDYVRVSTFIFSGITSLLLGTMTLLASVIQVYNSDIIPEGIFFIATTILGVLVMVLGSLLLFMGFRSDFYHDVMRVEVQKILNAEITADIHANTTDHKDEQSEGKSPSYAEKYGWHYGGKLCFKKRHYTALRPEIIQAFKYFMTTLNT